MREIRLAQQGDTARQKELWKLCFGDSEHYIDFYYDNHYKENETILLLEDREIYSMLTMLPIKIIFPNIQSFNSAMLYAIATHPQYQNRGFASRLIDFAHENLRENENAFSVLVPSAKQLFEFYRQQGFHDGFYVREVLLTQERIKSLDLSENYHCIISKTTPREYNKHRNELLSGKLYVAYADDEIAYQQKLSQQGGADIFTIEIDKMQGCAAIERVNSDKVFIKELLISDQLLSVAIKQITQLLPAKEYILRTPAFLGEQLEGAIRPFAMFKVVQEIDLEIIADDLGYLGFAFD